MAVFVLVHGTWGGGWQWQRVAEHLRAAGHAVFTPTLTGCGDRHHSANDGTVITLSRHIDDVTELLFFDDLTGVVLVGWSYGAHVVAGVADVATDRVAALVNLDGGLAVEGRSMLDEMDDEGLEQMRDKLAEGRATGWIPAPTAADLEDVLFEPSLRTWVGARVRPHPYASWTGPFPNRGGGRHRVRSTYLRCTWEDTAGEPFEEDAAVTPLRDSSMWTVTELPVNHLGLLYAPGLVAEALLVAAGA